MGECIDIEEIVVELNRLREEINRIINKLTIGEDEEEALIALAETIFGADP